MRSSRLVKRDPENQIATLRRVSKNFITETLSPTLDSDFNYAGRFEVAPKPAGMSAASKNRNSTYEIMEAKDVSPEGMEYNHNSPPMQVPMLLSPETLQKLMTPVEKPKVFGFSSDSNLKPRFKRSKSDWTTTSRRKSYPQPGSRDLASKAIHSSREVSDRNQSSNDIYSIGQGRKGESLWGHLTPDYKDLGFAQNGNFCSNTKSNHAKYGDQWSRVKYVVPDVEQLDPNLNLFQTINNSSPNNYLQPQKMLEEFSEEEESDNKSSSPSIRLEEPDKSSSPSIRLEFQGGSHQLQRPYTNTSEANFSDDSSPGGSILNINLNSNKQAPTPQVENTDLVIDLPLPEEKRDILFFKKFFRNATSVIQAGNWEIPVHGSIIRIRSPKLAKELMESRAQKLQCGKSSRRRLIRRTRSLLSNGKEQGDLPLNYYRIEKPPRAVFEFLKTFYPQCKMDLSSLKTWTEVLALSELCEEYNVPDVDTIKRQCSDHLKTILSELDLDDIIHLYKAEPKLKLQILPRLAEMLLRGDIDGDKLGMFDIQLWNEVMRAAVWKKRREGVDYVKLIVDILTWTVVFMSDVTLADFECYLDQVSGFPDDMEATTGFCNTIKSDAVEVILMLIEQLRPELQIQFWRRLSDYQFKCLKNNLG